MFGWASKVVLALEFVFRHVFTHSWVTLSISNHGITGTYHGQAPYRTCQVQTQLGDFFLIHAWLRIMFPRNFVSIFFAFPHGMHFCYWREVNFLFVNWASQSSLRIIQGPVLLFPQVMLSKQEKYGALQQLQLANNKDAYQCRGRTVRGRRSSAVRHKNFQDSSFHLGGTEQFTPNYPSGPIKGLNISKKCENLSIKDCLMSKNVYWTEKTRLAKPVAPIQSEEYLCGTMTSKLSSCNQDLATAQNKICGENGIVS